MLDFIVPSTNPEYQMLGIPAFQDNYIWLYVNTRTKTGIVVDPGDAAPVLSVLDKRAIRLAAIFITHHHQDHTGGVSALAEAALLSYPGTALPIYGPAQESIASVTHPLSEGDKVSVPGFPSFTILDIPGHTRGHIAYYGAGLLFCGDTLFTAGCGRLFEGTPATLFNSLQKINQLPPDTLIYCAHEYTEKNLAFALTVDPHNQALQDRYKQVQEQRAKFQATVPSELGLEQKTNPFLRTDRLDIFTALRAAKDRF
jgi:hydroxyacylglutathione hydrolase